MAFSAKVITGTLPTANNGYTDFTSSGFGTPDAAIVFASVAGTSGNNPYTGAQYGIGFWDGTSQGAVGMSMGDNSASMLGFSYVGTGRALAFPNLSSNVLQIDAVCSAITDGVRLTKQTGATGVVRYAVVILLKGVSAAYVPSGREYITPAASATTKTFTTGFSPDLLFFASSFGTSTSNDLTSTPFSYLSLGLAHRNSVGEISQACAAVGNVPSIATSKVTEIISDELIWVRAYDDDSTPFASIDSFEATGFKLAVGASANTSVRRVVFMALKLDDPDDAFIDIISTETSTGDKAYSPGVTPDVLGFVGTPLTAVNTLSTASPQSMTLGAADSDTQACVVVGAKDNVATSSTYSRYDGSNALNLRTDDDSAVTVASVKSLDAGGYTLTYSTADATARKVLVWGIGAGTPLDPQIDDIDTDNIIDAAQTGVEIHGQGLQQGVAARIVKGTRGIYVGNYTADETGPTFDVPPLQDLLDAGIKFGTVKVEVVK